MAGSDQQQTALGWALRSARESRELTLRQVAELMGRKASDSGLISRWESGARRPKAADVALLVEVLEIEGGDAAHLMDLANGANSGEPWLAGSPPERRQQLNQLLAAERTATEITDVAPLILPGVLQTRDVIRNQMVEANVPEDEVDERVITRIGRRDVVTRPDPAHLAVFLGEAAIRTVNGGRRIWADQLRYLLEMAELPNIDLHHVPFAAGWSPLQIGGFILIESTEAPPIVSLDLHGRGVMLKSGEDIELYRRQVEAVREKAIDPAATTKLIAKVLAELEQE
ncbi:helix-turn-helix transcriptional regulator [Amycolatopsis sp. NPDC005232]|uniref:helix-turn-helix domain-containing protein n=1 Tax=Amycolatopsis sp. NPDC005232 TaxID=3157027 RepID=UPI0033B97D1A